MFSLCRSWSPSLLLAPSRLSHHHHRRVFGSSWVTWMTVSCGAFCLCWPASASFSFSSRFSSFLSVFSTHFHLILFCYLFYSHLLLTFTRKEIIFCSPCGHLLTCVLWLIIKPAHWNSVVLFLLLRFGCINGCSLRGKHTFCCACTENRNNMNSSASACSCAPFCRSRLTFSNEIYIPCILHISLSIYIYMYIKCIYLFYNSCNCIRSSGKSR